MKRILHVLGSLDRGGTESMLMNYYRHIDREKVQFDFVIHTPNHCDFEDEVLSLGGIIHRVPRFTLINMIQYKRAWKRFFSQHREYQIIHIHHFLIAGIVLPIAAREGISVRIAHSHNTKPPIFILKERIMWLFHRDLIKYSTLRLACSYDAGKYLFGDEPFQIFYNAIETDKFQFDEDKRNKIRNEFGFNGKDLVIGHIGSFRTRQKNHSFLIDIFYELSKVRQNVKLLLIGNGGLMNEIKSKVNSLGLTDKCVFAGVREDVPDLLSAMDIFLLPSFFEGLTVVGIEAQASGLPCIFSDTLSNDTCITDLVTKVSLEKDAKYWATVVNSVDIGKERASYHCEVAKAGYDVNMNIKKLSGFYNV